MRRRRRNVLKIKRAGSRETFFFSSPSGLALTRRGFWVFLWNSEAVGAVKKKRRMLAKKMHAIKIIKAPDTWWRLRKGKIPSRPEEDTRSRSEWKRPGRRDCRRLRHKLQSWALTGVLDDEQRRN